MRWEDGEAPEGWKLCTLGDVTTVIGGGTPKTTEGGNFSDEHGHPWITPADLTGYKEKYISRGRRFLTDRGLATSSAKYMPAGTVLFSSRAPIGYVAIAANPVTTNQGFRSFVPSEQLDSEYLYYALKSLRQLAEQFASGTTFAEISGSKAARLPIAFPAMGEQRAIARVVGSLERKRSSGASHLAAATQAIEHFRQSVLAASCSGRLTAAWRQEHLDLEPASELIVRSKLAAKAAGQRLDKIVERKPDYLEIPETWEWAPLGWLAAIKGGIQKQPKRTPRSNAYPYLRVANVLRGRLDLSEIHRMELFDGELETYRLEPHDLLVIEGNGSLTEIGRSAIWAGEIENCVHQNHIIRVRCLEIDPYYIDLFWNSPVGSHEIAELAVTSAGLYNLSVGKVSAFPVPIPPLEEQREIVRQASRMLELADGLMSRVDLASRAVDRSSQAVLAKAFRGELNRLGGASRVKGSQSDNAIPVA